MLRIANTLLAIAMVSGTLTLTGATWIETIFGVDPDRGTGSLEALIASTTILVALFSVAVGLGRRPGRHSARGTWRADTRGR